jgi:uncharacterized SAM-binding protein YcdF (DUF218 family)
MRNKVMSVLIISVILIVLGGTLFLNKDKILYAIGDHLIINNELQPADVIHVIAGDDYRTEYAIQLYKQGYAKNLFFTGGFCKFHGYLHGEHGQQLAIKEGIPPEVIAFDDSSVISTFDEAVILKAWMDQNSETVSSIIVVSDPFHMRRARWTYRKILGKDAKISMAPVPFEQTVNLQRMWWTDESSRSYVKEEYVKLIYYALRYQLSWGKFKEWLAAFDYE